MQLQSTARGAVELTRPGNALAAGALTLVGAGVAGDPVTSAAVAATVATVFATGAGMAINDYFDREIDAINRPDRPLPRGAVSPRFALGQSVVMFTMAVGLALMLPIAAIAIALFNLMLLIAYTTAFKGTPGAGNGVVAFLGGSTFLFGGAAVENVSATAVLFVLAAVATFTREIIKDVEDVPGDKAEGLNTLPIAIGSRRALGIAAVSLLIGVVVSPVPFLRGTFGIGYLLVVVPAVGVMLLGMYQSVRDPARGQQNVKRGMYLAIVAFVVGRVSMLL